MDKDEKEEKEEEKEEKARNVLLVHCWYNRLVFVAACYL